MCALSRGLATAKPVPVKGAAAAAQPELSPETVVLLADPCLLELPLEALRSLRSLYVGGVTRDVSLQLLHNRANRDPGIFDTFLYVRLRVRTPFKKSFSFSCIV